MEYIFIFLFILLAAAFVAGGLFVSRLIAPHRPGKIKNSPYECGVPNIGGAWIKFHTGYYLFALLFLVFDVESAFLFPWAVSFREVGFVGLVEIGIFMAILLIGLLYAWKKGILKWV